MDNNLILKILLELLISIGCLCVGVKAVIGKKFHDRHRIVRGSKAVFGGIIGIIIGLGLLVCTIVDFIK